MSAGFCDPRQVEFVDEAPLDGPVEPLTAAAGLGRVGADVLDAEVGEGAADLGRMGPVDGAAGRGGVKGPVGTVPIQRDGQAPGGADRMQRAEDRRRGFAGPQLRVEQPLGRVVDDGDQRLPLLGPVPQPDMRTAIQVQELAKASAGLPPSAVPAPRPGRAHQPGRLQGQPDEAMGRPHRVLPPGEAVKVADIPARKALAIEPQNALHFRRRRLAARRAHPPAVIEGHGPAGFIPGAPAPTLRGSTPRMSAACNQVMAPLNARTMTWIFMARSTAAAA
jgi:hypothetical protein